MVRVTPLSLVLTAVLLLGAPLAQAQSKTQPQSKPLPMSMAPTQSKPKVPLVPSQLVFEPNRGQAKSDVQWLARGAGYAIAIDSAGATLEFRDHLAATPPSSLRNVFQRGQKLDVKRPKTTRTPSSLVKFHLSGGANWKAEGVSPTGGISNYFMGKNPKNWHANIPQYAQVKASGIYNGIDLVFHGDQSALEYDFVVAPGADPNQIHLQFDGAAGLKVDKDHGDLVLTTPGGMELRHAQPKIYQEVAGKKVPVQGGFELQKEGTAGFKLGSYNSKLPLVIDPTIRFTTFLSGSDYDQANAIAVDGRGYSYVTGVTNSSNFVVYGGIQGNSDNTDAFVTKLGPGGNISFSTYLGGGDEDYGEGIAVDASGVYVEGQTRSDDFPLMQAIQVNQRGDSDVFVTKLSLMGNALIYSTYLGGSDNEQGAAIAVDAAQSAYVTGFTQSTDFPIVGYSIQTNFPLRGGYELDQHVDEFNPNGFIAKFSPSGTTLEYSTYLGGSEVSSISAIAVDSSLFAYVTGETCAPDFPYAGLLSESFSTECSAFVTKISPAGDSLIYSTSLGSENIIGTGIAVDSAGNAYVAGTAFFNDAFVAKVLPTGAVAYSKFIGGTDGVTLGLGIAIDSFGDMYVAGNTSSTTIPGAPAIAPNPTAGYFMKFNQNGTGPLYTFFLGASIDGIAVVRPPVRLGLLSCPTIYTTGYRFTGGHQTSNEDAFVVKLDECGLVVNQNPNQP